MTNNPSLITLYHGSFAREGEDIATRASTILTLAQMDVLKGPEAPRSDFSSTRRGFYLTPSWNCARTWTLATTMSGDTPIISKYELDLTDLTVYNFGTDRAGPLHKKWEELIRWSWTNYTEDHADYKEYEVIIGITSKGTRDGTVDTDPLIINGEVMIQVALFSDKALSKLRYVSHEVVERDRWSF